MYRSVAVALASLLASGALAAPARAPAGGEGLSASPQDHLPEALERHLVDRMQENLQALAKRGETIAAPAQQGLEWPLGPLPGAGVQLHGVSNFVDLDSAFPDKLRDYSCGTRTYDNAQGYNHGGTDFFIWPFAWALMDAGAVDVRAAAAGTLLDREDGNPDRSCSMNAPNTPNYAMVLHADGTVAWYLHMKRGSVTTRPIGSTIAAGEVLGKVGSSGISTGPHLHFELRSGTTQSAAVLDPFNGQCNARPSDWAEQRPYRDSAINSLSTHGAQPALAQCPSTQDQPHYKDQFEPGDPIYFLAAYRDLSKGQPTSFRVRRPDGSVFDSWSFDLSSQAGAPQAYNGSYWYWSTTLPVNAPEGLWRFEAEFLGQSVAHDFRVGDAPAAIPDPRGLIGIWYDPASSGQGMELHWLESDLLAVFFYGHRDNGENMYLIGLRPGLFGYGETIEVELARTLNGRFNGLDPDAIQRPAWGTLELTFHSCSEATARLSGTDGTQVLELQRLARTPGLDCD